MTYSGIPTTKRVLDRALRELVESHRVYVEESRCGPDGSRAKAAYPRFQKAQSEILDIAYVLYPAPPKTTEGAGS